MAMADELYKFYDGDMISYIQSQLPRQIADKVTIDIITDAYHLRTKALFRDAKGQVFGECWLEEEYIGQRLVSCRVPENVIAHLCVSVP